MRILRRAAATAPRHPAAVRAVTALGSRPAAYAAVGTCVLAQARRGTSAQAARMLVVVVGGDLARAALARLVGRERPPATLRHAHFRGPSFPSRHATLATLAAVSVVATVPPRRRRPAEGCALTAAAGVGVSRLRLGVHWPSDVLAGHVFAGGWWALSWMLWPPRAWPAAPDAAVQDPRRAGRARSQALAGTAR